MRKISWLFVLLLAGVKANAAPYFRLLDLNHPQVTAGSLFDPQHISQTQAASFLNVVTHSTKDGCLLPKVVCEDWSALQIGGTFTGTNKLFGLGPQWNLLPFIGLGSLYTFPSGINFSMSAGPKWLVAPDQNWKGYFRLSIEGELKF